jgi:hypothetical protein
MQLIQLELSHSNFFCPVTGEVILDEKDTPMNDNAKSLMGFWHTELLEEPSIKNNSLKRAWDKLCLDLEKETGGDVAGYEDLEEFLKNYDSQTWVVFVITNSGVGHGFSSSTHYFVIDMETTR